LKWTDGPVQLPPLPERIFRSRLIRGGKSDVRQTESRIEISVKPADRDPADTVIALDLAKRN